MAKRISKKLMIGLGSTLAFTATGFLSGLGIKALNNPYVNQNKLNTINQLGFNDIPQANIASQNMFNLPKLTSISLGNVQLGQTITPYGWLSRLDSNRSQLTLTGWNGELLWVSNSLQDDYNGRIYDAKYDWNTDTILLIRYGHINGGFWIPGASGPSNQYFSVLDAKTGREILTRQRNNANQQQIYNVIKDNFSDTAGNTPRYSSLFNLDLASWKNNSNQVIFNYIPNFMQLIEKNAADVGHSLPSLKTVLSKFADLSSQIIFYKDYNGTDQANNITLQFNNLIANSSQIDINNNTWTFGNETLQLSDFALLINPFVTTGDNLGEVLIHFIVANKAGRILHKIFGFRVLPEQNQEFLSQFDQTEEIENSIMKVLPNQWSNSKQWSNDFIAANLRVNRNFFNSNSVVAAYPYAANNSSPAGQNFPIFNVVQLLINPTTGLIDRTQSATNLLKTTNFNFGEQIYNYWSQNQNNRIFNPWPIRRSANWDSTNLNHNYNRLISVSPFDNTIIFAASPNFANKTITNHNDHTFNWANFWIATNNKPNGKGNYHPLLIPNDNWTGNGAIDTDMLDVIGSNVTNTLYYKGFTFDLASLINEGNKKSLNLYFNTNPFRWQNYGGQSRTVKIGLLEDVLKKDTNNTFWLNNVTDVIASSGNTKPAFDAPITKSSFSTFIHARADLRQWYPRTWQNANKPANKYVVGEQINGLESSKKRVVATSYNGKINDPNINSIEAVDLLSHWKDPALTGAAASKWDQNYDRLAVKRAKIVVKEMAKADPANQNGFLLPVEISWNPTTNIINKYQSLFANDSNQLAKLTLKRTEELNHVSQEVDKEWSTNVRMTNFGWNNQTLNAQANFNYANPINNFANKTSARVNANFRLFLQIEKPNSPNWRFTSDQNKFFQKYPVVPATGETGFQTILNEYIKWKAANLNFQRATTADDGLQNLKINGFVGLDGNFEGSSKTVYLEGKKTIIQINEQTNELLLHEDTFKQSRLVYAQQAINFDDASQWGWGAEGIKVINNSWVPGSIPNKTEKFLLSFNPTTEFNDNLVRLSGNNQQALLKPIYAENANDVLEIRPLNTTEFVNRFRNFNQLTNLFVGFEYLEYGAATTGWQQLGTKQFWTDTEIRNKLDQNNGKLVFNSVSNNIEKIRFRLFENSGDVNNFIDFNGNFASTNSKFISDEYQVAPKTLTIEPSWFNQPLNSNDNWAESLSSTNFENYEETVLQSDNLLVQEKSKLKFQYKFSDQNNENQWLDRDPFLASLQNRLLNDFLNSNNTNSIFSLWNGTQGIKIDVRIVKKNATDTSIEIAGTASGTVDTTNLKNKVDLSSYLNVLTSQKTIATQQPGQEGKISSFTPPANSSGKTFERIGQILQTAGISYQYKQWDLSDPNNPQWSSNWIANKNDVNSFNITKPEIKLGFNISNNFSVKLFNGTQEINDSTEFILALDIPKVIKVNDTLIEAFKTAAPLSGNTFQLQIDETKETNLINEIIQFNNNAAGSNSSDFNDLINQMTIEYALGNETTFYAKNNFISELASRIDQDQNNNQIRFRLVLKSTANSDFILHSSATTPWELLADGNNVVKKYLHGKALENEIKQPNAITIQGESINSISYNYPPNIQKLVNGEWPGLSLEYSFANIDPNQQSGTDPTKNWVDNDLPNSVQPGIKKIYVRINLEETNSQYIYGPQENNNRQRGEIDLGQLKIPVKVNSSWIENTKLNNSTTPITLTSVLNTAFFDDYQTRVFAELKKNNPNLDQATLDKLTLKFNFNQQNNLSAADLIREIQAYQQNFSAQHLGILQLWDRNNNGEVIQATFAKVDSNDQSINFVDAITNQTTQQLSANVDTSQITTEINLDHFINALTTKKTAVDLLNGQAGTISQFYPPAVNAANPATFLSGKTYDEIANRLATIGIEIVFRQIGTDDETWINKANVQKYDQTKGILHLAFRNQSSNINLSFSNAPAVGPNANSENNPIILILNAPKQISITANDVTGFINDSAIRGNTKFLEIDQALPKITKLINDIKTANKVATNNPDFDNAPLQIVFSLGDSSSFYDLNELKTELAQQTNDQTSNRLTFKFVVPDDQNENWTVKTDQSVYELYSPNLSDTAPIKIFVHDGGLADTLLKQTSFSGSNTNISWIWPNNNVNPNAEIISAPGIGLKLEFTFNANVANNDPVGSDPLTGWSSAIPNQAPLGQSQVWIRIVPKAGYVYEKDQSQTNPYKIGLNLTNLKQEITVNQEWLNQSLRVANGDLLNNINLNDLQNYENSVFNAIGNHLSQSIKEQLEIRYSFNNEDDLTKNDLLSKLTTYQQSYSNGLDLGILQLWNGNSGKEIKAHFVSKNPDIYIVLPNNHEQLVNTTTIKTFIDFRNVLNWLNTIKIEVEEKPGVPNSIQNLIFKNVDATNDSYFHNKSWNQVEQALGSFGITIQYRALTSTNQNQPNDDWQDHYNLLDTYDPLIGKIQIRLKFDSQKSTNLKVQWQNNQNIESTLNNPSSAFDVKLKIKLMLQIDSATVKQFISSPDVIQGNTKFLEINAAAEKQMIQAIKNLNATNNPEFNQANLIVQYQIGEAEASGIWRTREEFLNFLKQETTDQITNKIVFRFAISDDQASDFGISRQNFYTLNEKEEPAAGIKIAYYINENNLETLADNINLTGTNLQLQWNWPSDLNVDNATSLVQGPLGKGLRVEYTLKANAGYNDNLGTNIATDWVSDQPNQIPANATILSIRLKAIAGYVYGAPNPGVHQVNLNLTRYIEVDPNWLQKSFAAVEIHNLEVQHVNALSNQILDHLSDANLRNKVEIVFNFNQKNNLSAVELINEIKSLLNPTNDQTFGILQLWNNQTGLKIQANFKIKAGISDYQIFNQQTNQAGTDYQDLITTNVITEIDLINGFEQILQGLIKATTQADGSIRIEMPNFPQGDFVLSGRNWTDVISRLQTVGIIVEYQEILNKNDFGAWTENLNEIKKYNPNINQFNLRFKWNSNLASNVKVKITTTDIIDSQKLISETYALNLNLPLKLTLNDQAIKSFVADQITLSGNTKFLEINEQKEAELIDAIIEFNKQNNPLAAQAAGRVEILYSLGNGQNPNWLNRQQFKEFLAAQTVDQITNQIQFKFNIKSKTKQNNEIDFIIEDTVQELNPHEVPAANIKIPYYIHSGQWENKASQVAIDGNNNQINWIWNGLSVDDSNLVDVLAGKGLKIQFSTKDNIDYNAPENTLEQGWTDQRPTSVSLNTNHIYIRLIQAHNGFVYQAQAEQNARAHQVNFQDFKFQIQVQNQWLKIPLNVASQQRIDQIQITDIENYEATVLNNISPNNLQNQVGLTYAFNNETNLDKSALLAKIKQLLNDFDGSNLGLVQLDNGKGTGLAIQASFIIKPKTNPTDKDYELIEPTNQLSAKIDTSQIKTHIDLQPYINYLKNNSLSVQGADPNTGALDAILMPIFPQTNPIQPLSGKTFDEIENRLLEMGIKFEARALGNGVSNAWVPINAIKQYDPTNGKIALRLVFEVGKADNLVLSVLTPDDQTIAKPEGEAIELILQVPLKVEIDDQLVQNLFVQLDDSISGNTRFLEINKTNEQNLVAEIIKANEKDNPSFAKLADRLKVEYQIKNNNNWKEAAAFETFLKNTTTDWNSNEIKFRFVLKNNTDNEFIIDQQEFTLQPEEIGQKTTRVKIYINDANYENLADQIKIQGTNNNFTYVWPNGFPIESTTGQIQGIPGLQIQYTTKPDQNNADYSNTNQDPAVGWVNQQVNQIDPVNRYLAIQLVATDGYVYGPQFKSSNPNPNPDDTTISWAVHQIVTETIVSEIQINMNAFNQISFNGEFPNINLQELETFEQKAKQAATSITALHEKMQFQYQVSQGQQVLFAFNDLESLQQWLKAYPTNNDETAGLLKFNAGGSTDFVTITARLQAIDQNQYVVLDQNGGSSFEEQKLSAENGRAVKTDNYVSVFDLRDYEQVLLQQFIELPANANASNIVGFNPPGMSRVNQGFLHGKTFNQIKTILNRLGLILEYKAQDQNNNQWVSQEQIVSLNAKNELFMRFRIDETKVNQANLTQFANSFKLQTNSNPTGNLDSNQNYATDPIKLKVDLPILINVNSADLQDEALKLVGNTWKVANTAQINQQVQKLVATAKASNNTGNTNIDNAPLTIQFQLPGLVQNNIEWFEINKLAEILLSITNQNWKTNQINVRWFVDQTFTDANGFRYQISDSQMVVLQQKEESQTAKLKMYIHSIDQYSKTEAIQAALKPSGTTKKYLIKGIEEWMAMLVDQASGLEIQLSNAKNPSTSDWLIYTDQQSLPTPLNSDLDLWFRYQVKAGYQYDGALATDAEHSDKIGLDTSGIKLILELTTDWLKQIVLAGNLKNLEITETAAKQALIASGKLPTNNPDLVFFEYSFNNQEWDQANAFKAKLQAQSGQKDAANFIIKREDIKVRFGLQATNNAYDLEIDGTLIDQFNRNDFNVSLINDTEQLNTAVQGYIEIEHLQYFVIDSFAIQGTNNAPKLIVNNRLAMEALMQVYASDGLFNILISTQKLANGAWDWSANKSILTNTNQFIDPDTGLINLGVSLDASRQVALKFVSKKNQYDIYHQGTKEPDGYTLDISDNVKIIVEIENPFTTANKSLGVRFRDDQDNAKYYQGQGGFKLTTFDLNTNQTEITSALAFLNASHLDPSEKNALEFVYHVFDNKPSAQEFAAITQKEVINDYANSNWKSLTDLFDPNGPNGFTTNLKLKVGQYVTVALRVKEEFATAEDGFALKNDAYSILDPVGFSQTQEHLAGRVSGYKINVDQVKIATNEIQVGNLIKSSTPLDGYAFLQRINFKQDQEDNYLGVQLKIKLYNDFHRDQNGQIWEVANQKLVKRTNGPNTQIKGYYQDASGTEILDQNGQRIPILVDQTTGKLTAPQANQQPTKEQLLDDFGDGIFGFNIVNTIAPEFGLFKNQKIEIEYEAKSGLQQNNLADFVLDKQKTINIEQWISPKIKFVIDNSQNITYNFVQDDFSGENIKYEGNDPNKPQDAISGSSHIATPLKLIRQDNQQSTIISGHDGPSSVRALENQLASDFNGQVQFEYTYNQADGGETVFSGADIYKLRNLKNNDRIILRMVSKDPDLVFLEAPDPLVINVKGLIGTAPDQEKLQFLRVEQNGTIDGQATFRILVSDPQNDYVTDENLLRGWKFVVQVWNANKEIKIPWTDQQDQIRNLNNGDKVEWKLVDERNNHVQDAYYNTVAMQHAFNPGDGSTTYHFAQVNYHSGANSQQIYQNGIGAYPENDQIYPENSGFVISGLEAAIEKFPISISGFSNVFNTLNPTYEGFNGQGALKFDERYLNELYYVDTEGRLNAKPQITTFKQEDQTTAEFKEVTLSRFLANVTFYTADPQLEPLQSGFKFTSNETNITNHLKNGDQLWAQFDVLQQGENGSQSTTLTTQLPDVSGLNDVPDNMGPLWFVLMAAGAVMTLGLLTVIYFWMRHRKLK